jgi:hypothetical protein
MILSCIKLKLDTVGFCESMDCFVQAVMITKAPKKSVAILRKRFCMILSVDIFPYLMVFLQESLVKDKPLFRDNKGFNYPYIITKFYG